MAQDRSLPPLTALQAFLAAGETGSFRDAARRLRVTPSAISHQIRALESWLERPLFTRSARQVQLTAEGRRLLKSVGAAFARIRETSDAIRAADAKTTVLRVSALPLFTSAWLIPRLEDFERKHPDIAFEIGTTNRIVDLTREPIDLAIRNLRAPTPGLAVRKLLDVRQVPVCTRKLAEQLTTPADLAGQTLIHISARADSWARWLRAVGCDGLRPRRNLSFDSVPDALEAAARGRGVAMGIDPLVWESPIARDLVAPFKERVAGDASYYLAWRKADFARPPLRAFVDWLVTEMALFRRSAARRHGH
jgi:LysR family glycine cleavage system transcriptional activator